MANFSHHLVLRPPLKEFPLKLGIGTVGQKLEWWVYRAEKEVRRYLQTYEYNAPTWQTDRQTDGRQQRPHLRIASRGKNSNVTRSESCCTSVLMLELADEHVWQCEHHRNRDFDPTSHSTTASRLLLCRCYIKWNTLAELKQ